MFYFINNGKQNSLIGIFCEGKMYTIEDIINPSMRLLDDKKYLRFVLINGNIDIGVDTDKLNGDSEYSTINIASIFDAFELRFNSKQLTTIILTGVGESVATAEWKKKICAMFEKSLVNNPDIGCSLTDIDAMLLSRVKFNNGNSDSKMFLDKNDILRNKSVLDNTDKDTSSFISKFVISHPDNYENKPLTGEEQEIMFYSNSTSVMPKYDDVQSITFGTIDEYYLKECVPAYHRYIGGYVNYSQGSEEYTGSYRGGPYIQDSAVASLLNDVNYRTILQKSPSLYAGRNIGGMKVTVTSEYVTGSDEYDSDPIRSNEKKYYDELCAFLDECLEKDILNATLSEWYSVGYMNLFKEHFPQITNSTVSLNKIDFETYKPVDGKVLKGTHSRAEMAEVEEYNNKLYAERGFNMERLEKIGVTIDTFRAYNKCSPTAFKWFRYAINLALVANRAYSGLVQLPIGYDIWEFVRTIRRGKYNFDQKMGLFQNEIIIQGNRQVSFDDIDFAYEKKMQLENKPDEIDPPTSADYADMGTDAWDKYWLNTDTVGKESSYIRDSDSSSENVQRIIDTDENERYGDIGGILGSILTYCMRSNRLYAMPESLIKCLRFGRHKPKNLQIEGVEEKVDLTTGRILRAINKDNPVLFYDKYKYMLVNVIVSGKMEGNIRRYMISNVGAQNPGNVVVGVCLSCRYEQSDGSTEVVNEYIDIDTFVSNKKLQESIANWDGEKMLSNTTGEDGTDHKNPEVEVESLDAMLNRTYSNTISVITHNNSRILGVLDEHLDVLQDKNKKATKVINSLRRGGFNLFSLLKEIDRVNDINRCIKYVSLNKVTNRIEVCMDEREVKELILVELFCKYGGIIKEVSGVNGSAVDILSDSVKAWSSVSDYSLNLVKVSDDDAVENPTVAYMKLMKSKLQIGLDYAAVPIVLNAESRNVTYFMFRGTDPSDGKAKVIYIASGAKAAKEDVKTITNGRIAKVSTIAKIVNTIKTAMQTSKNNGRNITVESCISERFQFIDYDTKESFISVISSMIV